MKKWRKTKFNIADDFDKVFEGYTQGELWNGWECPRFTKEVGLEIVKAFQPAKYDEKSDLFVFIIDDTNDATFDNVETFEGKNHNINGTIMRLYPIGAWHWVWDEYEEIKEDDE